jgi:prepilin-type N-terminal cleavage/methylation domain-containing protein
MLKRTINHLSQHAGVSLIELLVVISLLALVMTGITSMLISGMRAQQKVDASLRSQLDVRAVVYDLEKNIAEAKRKDSSDNQPVFQDDLISFPSQKGNEWITYAFAQPVGCSTETIIRLITDGKPVIPLTISTTDKQMINISTNSPDLFTTVGRVSEGPIFSYYGEDGVQITPDPATQTVTAPRNVRSVQVSFMTTVSEGHAQHQPTVSSTQINLRNF